MEPEGSEQLKIFTAASEGNIELIKELLQGGVDVNIVDETRDPVYGLRLFKTPLMYAAENGHTACVNFSY